jgi:hypothetical protein
VTPEHFFTIARSAAAPGDCVSVVLWAAVNPQASRPSHQKVHFRKSSVAPYARGTWALNIELPRLPPRQGCSLIEGLWPDDWPETDTSDTFIQTPGRGTRRSGSALVTKKTPLEGACFCV